MIGYFDVIVIAISIRSIRSQYLYTNLLINFRPTGKQNGTIAMQI